MVWDSEGVCEREDSIVEDLFQAADKDDGFSDSECSRGRKRKRGSGSRRSKKNKKKSESSSESESEEESSSSHSESGDEASEVALVAFNFTKENIWSHLVNMILLVTSGEPWTTLLSNSLSWLSLWSVSHSCWFWPEADGKKKKKNKTGKTNGKKNKKNNKKNKKGGKKETETQKKKRLEREETQRLKEEKANKLKAENELFGKAKKV